MQIDPSDRAKLMDAFSKPVEQIAEMENRLAFRGQHDEETGTDSYMARSWDRYFSDLSHGSYRSTCKFHGKRRRSLHRRRAWHYLLKNMNVLKDMFAHPSREIRVLDVGCSSGFFRRFLEGNMSIEDEKKFYYWGVDLRESMLIKGVEDVDDPNCGAVGTFTPTAYCAQDVKYGLPYKDGYFDYVLNFEMIKYLPTAQGIALIKEIKRVLKKGGHFYLSSSAPFKGAKTVGEREGFMRVMPHKELKARLEGEGFEVLKVSGSQANMRHLTSYILPEHQALFDTLLEQYPEEIVAAIMAPFYPDRNSQVTFVSTY